MTASRVKPVHSDDIALILRHLEQVAPEAREYRRNRILLTGATGFFGKWLTQTLLAMNDHWALENEFAIVTRDRGVALETSPWLASRQEVHWLESDIRSLRTNFKFTDVIHGATAASAALNVGRPDEMFETIVEGTRQVLALAEAAKCRRFQFLSSGAVYGTQPAAIENLPETYAGQPDPADPKSAYGRGKREAEEMCARLAAKSDMRLSLARCYAFVGAYLPLDTHFAAGNFMKCVLDGKPIAIGGDGTPTRSYLYAADLMVWLLTLFFKSPSARPYNVGSDVSISIREVAETVDRAGRKLKEERSKLSPSVTVAKTPDPARPLERYVPSVSRAQEELGLRVWTPLEDAFTRTLKWHMGL